MEVTEQIVKIANSFIGQEEIKGNLGFKDGEFAELMEAVGHESGQAWCAYFVELVWKLAFVQEQDVVKELNLLFSAGAVATWNNFRRSDWITSPSPRIGSVAIWQTYKNSQPHWSGHAAIVVDIKDMHIFTIDGNTNDKGGREGYIVAPKTRLLNFNLKSGLRPKGFIYPEKAIV